MGDILKEIGKIRNTFENFLEKSQCKEDEAILHIKELEGLITETTDSHKGDILHEVASFLKKELKEQQETEIVVTEMLKHIISLQVNVNEACSKGFDDGIEILAVQEEERKRVAMELHDSTVQNISSLIYKAEYCSKIIDSDVIKVKLELQIMIKSLKDIITEMRNTIYNLRPTVVQENNLNLLLRNHINYINTLNSDTNISYNNAGNTRSIKSICCMTIFRVVQEACQNAIKHAEASNISVKTEFQANGIFITVTDNGNGFSLRDIEHFEEKEKHFGISIMRERVKLLRGEFNIESQIGIGTCVSFHVENVYCDKGEDNGSD